MAEPPPEPKECGDDGQEDLIFLLRLRAKIETSGEQAPVTQHIDWIAAEEITRLSESVRGLMDTIRSFQKLHPDAL